MTSHPLPRTIAMKSTHDLIRHLLATLAYRTHKAALTAPSGFSNFKAGSGVRTPRQLIHHVNEMLFFAHRCFGNPGPRSLQFLSWEKEIERFRKILALLDADLAERRALNRELTLEMLLQGPFADALTHAGQLAMLRRLAGSSLPPEEFVFADIKVSGPRRTRSRR